ncbi:hypothetical protein GWO13_05730 [Candidatus Bathyarchaeota archaeon]|nr:hypothetical protein [Candidatus Bathyarchaeota archaeon]
MANFWLLFVWLPFAMLRTRLAHEIGRFTLRIQTLASKTELSKLTASELAVPDEETLQSFVNVILEIAQRHGRGARFIL